MAVRSRKSRFQTDPPGYAAFKRRFWAHHTRVGTPCGVCHGPIDYTLKWPHRYSKSIGHVIPRSHGGAAMDMANTRPEHLSCNTSRSDRMHIDGNGSSKPSTMPTGTASGDYAPSRDW